MDDSTSTLKPGSPSPAIRGALLGAVPWVASAVVASIGFPVAAQSLRLSLALGQNLQGLRKRDLKALELMTLAYSAAESVLTLGFGFWSLQRFGGVASQASFATMAFVSVAIGAPFTWQYARASWDRSYWRNPLFLSINRSISLVFGAAFAAAALSSWAALWLRHGSMVVGAIFPTLFGIVAIVFSIRFPAWRLRQEMESRLAQAEPWKWKPSRARTGDDRDAVVVGAGVGGLAAAALMAKRGMRVLVCEAHDKPGGACSSWTRRTSRGDFRFDAGVHNFSGVGPRGSVRGLLREVGREDAIEWLAVRREFRKDGIRLDASGSLTQVSQRLCALFPTERSGIDGVFQEMLSVHREMYAGLDGVSGLPGPPKTVEAMLAFPRTNPTMYRNLTIRYKDLVEGKVRDPALRNQLMAMCGYLTDDPATLGVLQVAPLFGYWIDGGWYPRGGSQVFSTELAQALTDFGGEIGLRTNVENILVEGGRVRGVALSNGTRVHAPVVVSDADLKRTFRELIRGERFDPRWERELSALRTGPSAAMVLLGIDRVPDVAPIVLCDGFSVAVPSLVDSSAAPRGCASVAVTMLLSNERAKALSVPGPDAKRAKKSMCDELIDRAEAVIPGLRERIVWREDAGPATFERYLRSSHGSIYGFERGAVDRGPRSCLEGLLLCGAGVYPGPGVEAAVLSGITAANAAAS